MKTKDRDPASYYAIILSFLKQAELNEEEYKILTNELKRYLIKKFENTGYIHPMITKFSTDLYREFYRLINFKDPYKKLKDQSNTEAEKILKGLNVESIEDAIKLSVRANQLDFGAVLIINPNINKMQQEFDDFKNTDLVLDDSEELIERIKNSKKILFLPDNAGEIIFDTALLKEINKYSPKNRIFIAAKESPMLNDVTYTELKDLNIDDYGTVISTGSNCFGLHEEDVSLEFKKLLKEADLIIAKGQAYLEFFTEYNLKNVFNITRIKHPVVTPSLGILTPHQNIVISSKRYSKDGKSYNFGTLHPKILDRTKLKENVEKLREENKKIVTTNGIFDLLHLGHIKILEESKKIGDILIVGINSDRSAIEREHPYTPILNQNERLKILASLECVDYVTVYDEPTCLELLEEIKPDLHCVSEDYLNTKDIEDYTGNIHIIPKLGGYSTDSIIKRIIEINQIGEEIQISKEEVLDTIKKQKGILFAIPSIVFRESYSGRDIIAKNSKFEKDYTDERNYLPVEWWVMSATMAENEKKKENEGLTKIKINSKLIFLKDIITISEKEVIGNYSKVWPLTKILDIGGTPVKTSFSEIEEVPPIPTHIHSGCIKNGELEAPGKLEAYFFPPVNIPPYNKNFGEVITRLGLKPQITKEEFIEAVKKFGIDDKIYSLCNTFKTKAYDGWLIPPKTVHAPGPWITFEIQTAQDDFNLLSWQLGKTLKNNELEKARNDLLLRGFKDEKELVEKAIDWDTSTDPNFEKKYYKPSSVIEEGLWGRRIQIFFDNFYGEGIEINPGESMIRNSDDRPFAGVVWSGKGKINGNNLNCSFLEEKEFLVTPNTKVEIKNTSDTPLLIYTVFPIKKFYD